MIGALKSLWRHQGGNSVVEMALITPVLATMLVGTIDVANGFSTRLKLEQVAQRIVEEVQQEKKPFSSTYSDLQTEAATAAGVSSSNVTVTNWVKCSNNGTTWTSKSSFTTDWDKDFCNTSSATYSYQSHYIEVSITGSYTPFFSGSLPGVGTNGTITLHGTAGARFQE
jgi:Flp pilus assembly protein TadG